MTKQSYDALERKIAHFVRDVKSPRSINGNLDICLGTSLGSVREENQDRALLIYAEYPNNPDRNFLLGVVCDGMGGLVGGQEAAILAISVFASSFLRGGRLPFVERLRVSIKSADAAVYSRFKGAGGSTISAALVTKDGRSIGVNVGDSRIYAISDYREVKQLSKDDTLAELLGDYEPDHKNRLVQYVGMGEGVEARFSYTYIGEYSSLLITTDGVHGTSTEALAQIVRSTENNFELLRRLISFSEIMGGRDNGTALVMPTRINGSQDSSIQGLNLTFMSPFKNLEIWIPLNIDDDRHEDLLQTEAQFAAQSEKSPPKERSTAARKKRKNEDKGRVTQKKKKVRHVSDDGWLPIEDINNPPLKVRFPGKRRR